jgi:hypothetical protein
VVKLKENSHVHLRQTGEQVETYEKTPYLRLNSMEDINPNRMFSNSKKKPNFDR